MRRVVRLDYNHLLWSLQLPEIIEMVRTEGMRPQLDDPTAPLGADTPSEFLYKAFHLQKSLR